MTTPIEDFNRKECCLIDALKVNAYTDIMLDPDNSTGIILDTSWGTVKLDLLSIVKAGETVTHLRLTPTGLCYEREDGETEFISGDDLSRVISLQLLKDIDIDKPISDGDVYIYNGDTNLFEPFDLKTFVTTTNTAINRINATLIQLDNRITDIENAIYGWPGDKTTKIPRGTLNVYGDVNNTGSHADGIFSHDPNTDEVNDLYFS